MTECDSIREQITAWIDKEASAADSSRIEAHIGSCAACAAEARSLRRAIDWQTERLSAALVEDPVDVTALRVAVRRQLAALRERDEETRSWSWIFRPFAVAATGAALALLLVIWVTPEPQPLLVSIGVEVPPDEVAKRPDKYRYLDVMENLDVLEHLDAVQAVRLEDEHAKAGGVWKG